MKPSDDVFKTKKNGFLVSTVKFAPSFYDGVWETMVFRVYTDQLDEHVDYTDLDCIRTENLNDARSAHQTMVEKYCNS